MKRVRRWLSAIACMALLPPAGALAAQTEASPEISASHAILIEYASGRVVYESAADERAFMASTTKIMTALLVLENCDVTELATVPDAAVQTEGSKAYLTRGEKLTVNDLLHGLMLASGNDAAITLAMHVAGTVADFAGLMNARAEALGCEDTHFVNPNGLPDDAHYTTARDLARIAAAAMRLPAFREIVNTTYHQTESGDINRTFKNKNKVLWQYEGGCGVKTGFTKAAGRCLVFAAERAGMLLIGCVLHAPDMWADAYALLDYGYANLMQKLLVDAARPLVSLPVTGSEKKRLAAYPVCDILYPIRRDGSDTVAFRIAAADTLTAPVRAGDTVGTLTLLVNGEDVGSTALIVTEGAPAAGVLDRLREILARFAA